MKNKKSNKTGRNLLAASLLVAGGYYLANRSQIVVLNIDPENKTVDYKAIIGLKIVSGQIDLNNASEEFHSSNNKTLSIVPINGTSVSFVITNSKNKVLDDVTVDMSGFLQNSIANSYVSKSHSCDCNIY